MNPAHEQQAEAAINNIIDFYGATEFLANNSLYKIYLLFPNLSEHIIQKSENLISLLGSFRESFARVANTQNIFFEEDRPHQHHHFSAPETGMLVLLVPPHLIICVDGNLLLSAEKMILESILGVCVNGNEGTSQFYQSAQFDMERVRSWIKGDVDEDTDFSLPANSFDYA